MGGVEDWRYLMQEKTIERADVDGFAIAEESEQAQAAPALTPQTRQGDGAREKVDINEHSHPSRSIASTALTAPDVDPLPPHDSESTHTRTSTTPPVQTPPPRRRASFNFSPSFHENDRRRSTASLGLGPHSFWAKLSSASSSPEPKHTLENNMFAAPSSGQVTSGQDLPEVYTEAVGYHAIAGDTRLRILPTPWPKESLPTPTSSLLSIASRQELLAAAGPETLVIGSTRAVREAFVKDGPSKDNVKQFQPQLSLPVPRLSQVAFSSDESTLIISAAEGGGLQIYDVSGLKQGNRDPAFQMPTNGVAVRSLIPNPAPEAAHLIALVLGQGHLMIANLKERKFETYQNGMVLKEGVSCVSWSNKGTQLTAGLGNGTAVQLTPSGELKAEIPKHPELEVDVHVSGVSWLDNNHWLIIYAPSKFDPDFPPDSIYCLVSRERNTKNFAFQKFAQDPCGTFGMNRSPPFHFINRLREYSPSLADVLLLSSTAAGDVGMIACSSIPLSSDPAAASTGNQYTTLTVANDARKAQLPLDELKMDTSPIGAALDLSSHDKVSRPMPAEEIDTSPTPLPGLAILNNEGILSYWWFVYSDSIRQGKVYPGLVVASGAQQLNQTQRQSVEPQPSIGFGAFSNRQSAFGSTSTPLSSPFGKPAAPAFGTPTSATTSAFGRPGGPGQNKSPWATMSTSTTQTGGGFGQPAFGSSTPLAQGGAFGAQAGGAIGSASGGGFGAVGGLGQSNSPWAAAPNQSLSEQKSNPFSGGGNAASPFSAFGSQQGEQKSQSPFGGVSDATSGFGALTQSSKPLFGNASTSTAPSMPNLPSFGSTMTIGSLLTNGSSGGPSSFGEPKSAWGTPSLSQQPSGVNEIREAEMGDAMEDDEKEKPETMQPPDHGFGLFNKPSNVSGTFRVQSSFKPDTDGKAVDESKRPEPSLFGAGFGNALADSQKPPEAQPREPPKKPLFGEVTPGSGSFFGQTATQKKHPNAEALPTKAFDGKIIKEEPQDAVEDAPLPPDPATYKARIEAEDAPLPPDPSTYKAQVDPGPAHLPQSPKQKAQVDDDEPPLPPSPKPQQRSPPAADLPLSPAGSSPIDLGANSPEETTVAQPETPANVAKTTGKPAPSWAFPSDTPQSPEVEESVQATSPLPSFTTTPSTLSKPQPSTTPFGSNKPLFAPPSSSKGPRSPSPTHRGRLFANQRSVTSPSPSRRNFSTTPMATPPTKSILPSPTREGSRQVSRQPLVGDSARLQPLTRPDSPLRLPRASEMSSETQKAAELNEDDEDDYDAEDAHVLAELSAPIQPTKQLAPFLAHKDYVGHVAGTGVPAQIEKVYRDINSMIDTLGLNSRSLKTWISGHEQFADDGRTRSDLNLDEPGVDEWSLIEIADLSVVQKEITETLDSERIDDVRAKVAELVDVRRQMAKLRTRNASLQQTLHSYQHPDEDVAASATPQSRRLRGSTASPSPRRRAGGLSPEQSSVLSSLRHSYTSMTTQLSAAEEALTLLRAKLASSAAANTNASTSFAASTSSFRTSTSTPPAQAKLPTVEAVIATIGKMTRMAEQKSGDLDVLEARMRRLRFRQRTEGQGLEDVLGAMTLRGSRDGTPMRTPPRGSRSARDAHLARKDGVNGKRDGATGRFELRHESDEEDGEAVDAKEEEDRERVADFLLRRQRRERVADLLKKSVAERGPMIISPS